MDAELAAEQAKILVVRVGALGDTLMATPLVRALKQRYPRIQIHFLAWHTAAPLLEQNPHLDRVHTLKLRNLPLSVSPEKRSLARVLEAEGYSRAVLLESAARYRKILERAKVEPILGFESTPFDPDLHSSANHLRAAGLADWKQLSLAPQLFLAEAERGQAAQWLANIPGPLVGLHGGYGPAQRKKDQQQRLKGWPVERFAQLGQQLIAKGCGLIVTGSAADRPAALEMSRSWPPERFRILAGETTVRQLSAVIAGLRLLVSVDSGPAHMAAALGRPLVVLWGPAKLQQVRPISGQAPVEIIRHPVPCAPCYDTPAMKSCRLNICMRRITPAEVLEASLRLIGL